MVVVKMDQDKRGKDNLQGYPLYCIVNGYSCWRSFPRTVFIGDQSSIRKDGCDIHGDTRSTREGDKSAASLSMQNRRMDCHWTAQWQSTHVFASKLCACWWLCRCAAIVWETKRLSSSAETLQKHDGRRIASTTIMLHKRFQRTRIDTLR